MPETKDSSAPGNDAETKGQAPGNREDLLQRDPKHTDNPTGVEQAAENAATENPS